MGSLQKSIVSIIYRASCTSSWFLLQCYRRNQRGTIQKRGKWYFCRDKQGLLTLNLLTAEVRELIFYTTKQHESQLTSYDVRLLFSMVLYMSNVFAHRVDKTHNSVLPPKLHLPLKSKKQFGCRS